MSLAAAMVVVAFALALVAFTGVAFARPGIAKQFLTRFASSARTHYAEQIVRLLVGASLVVYSPAMWQSRMFWVFGWAVIISSAALICIPWQVHRRLGERLLPLLIRHLKLYAAGSFALGAVLLFGVFAGVRV